MDHPLDRQATNHQIRIQVANGGYIVHAMTDDPDDEESCIATTSIFEGVETMLEYVGRIVKSFEGSGEQVEIPAKR